MSEPAQIFERDYYERLSRAENHWWCRGMTRIMDAMLADHVAFEGPVRFLDIGCGSGIGLSWAQRNLTQGLRLGVDVSRHGLRHCGRFDASVAQSVAEALPFADESVDLALCVDVLQHLDADAPAVAEIERVLAPGGLCFIRTNARSLTPPPVGSNLFTRPRLVGALETAGLEVLRCSRANALGSIVAEAGHLRAHLAQRKNEHAAQPQGHGGGYGGGLRLGNEESPEDLASTLKRFLLQLEAGWIARGGRLPAGHSLVCLAQKPGSASVRERAA